MPNICRFKDDKYSSDVYVYSDEEGYYCHVAKYRRDIDVDNLPPDPFPDYIDGEISEKEFGRKHRRYMDYVKSCPKERIGLEYDGKIISRNTAQGMIEMLSQLEVAGYHIPEKAYKKLRNYARD